MDQSVEVSTHRFHLAICVCTCMAMTMCILKFKFKFAKPITLTHQRLQSLKHILLSMHYYLMQFCVTSKVCINFVSCHFFGSTRNHNFFFSLRFCRNQRGNLSSNLYFIHPAGITGWKMKTCTRELSMLSSHMLMSTWVTQVVLSSLHLQTGGYRAKTESLYKHFE